MSLVFSSNHSSYNTGLGEAKNSSPSHMTAPNAEAPSKGTSATPCFLGNESHCGAWAAAETKAARADQKAHCFLRQPCCDRRRVRGGRAGHHLRVGRSTDWCPGVQKLLLPFKVKGQEGEGYVLPKCSDPVPPFSQEQAGSPALLAISFYDSMIRE